MRPEQDLLLGLLQTTLGSGVHEDIYRYDGFDNTAIVPDFYDNRAAGPPPNATTGDGGARLNALVGDLTDADRAAWAQAIRSMPQGNGGSNNFAIAGSQSASGAAIIAGDTHLDTEHPTFYYYIHLDTSEAGGDLNAIGASLPGTTSILFGHNDKMAWVPTTGFQDASDSYVEALVPGAVDENGDQTPYQVVFEGELVDLPERTEIFTVRDPVTGDVSETEVVMYQVPHHGPLIPNEGLGLPVALRVSIRWTGAHPSSLIVPFDTMSRATEWEEFRGAIDSYYTGGMHWLYADDRGDIGYTGYTRIPIRETLDRTAPPVGLLPGDGGFEWVASPEGSEFPYEAVAREDVPWVFQPEDGWIVTANNDAGGTMEDNDPFDDPVYISGIYDLGARAYVTSARIEALLEERLATYEDARGFQISSFSRVAERLLPYLFEAAARRPDLLDADAEQALEILESWDLECDIDQVGPTVFHGFMIVFIRDMYADTSDGLLGELLLQDMSSAVGQVFVESAMHFLDETDADIDAIEAGEMEFPSATGENYFDDLTTPELETRDEVLIGALDTALDDLSEMLAHLGADRDDMDTWLWGVAHTIQLDDPAAVVLPESSSDRLPMPGGLYTFQIADFDWLEEGEFPERFDSENISSNRFLFEMTPGAIYAEAILPGGQSERPDSPHHNDQLREFTENRYRPLRYYDAEIDAALEQTWLFSEGFPFKGTIAVE
jgi:penicillin amidase